MKKTISTETFSCRNGWIEGLCGRWIHIGQIDLKPLCKYMYIEFNTENLTVLCLSMKEKSEIWVQVRCGAQRGHPLHRRSQPSLVGRSRSPLCHSRVQRQSQCLREYHKLFIWSLFENPTGPFLEQCESQNLQKGAGIEKLSKSPPYFRPCINLKILKQIGINYAPTWQPLAWL